MTRDRYESLEYDGRLYDEMRRIESENEHLQKELKEKDKKIEKLNNDIKILLKENENKEKVILKYDNIINELEKTLLEWHQYWEDEDTYNFEYKNVYDYLQELKGDSSNE